MRILYILGFLPTYVKWEMEALAREGHQVLALLPSETGGGPTHRLWNSITGTGETAGVSTLRIMPFELFVSPVPALAGPSIRSLARFSGMIKALSAGEFRYFLAASETLRRLPGDWRPDHIHAHFAGDQAHIAGILADLLDRSYTVTTHATDIFVPRRPDRLRSVLADASEVVTISDFNRKYMKETGILRGNARVIRLGVPTGHLPERTVEAESPPGVCTASGLVEKKGVDALLEAAGLMKEKFPDLRFRIIGSDPEGTVLKQCRERAQGMPVEFAGVLTSGETLREVSRARFFVLPCVRSSTGDMDGIPVSIMEAMAMGVPVVSTAISGIPELITHGETGLLARPGSPESLAEMIERLLASPEEAEAMGKRGRARVLALHSPGRSARELTEVFNCAVDAHRKGAKK